MEQKLEPLLRVATALGLAEKVSRDAGVAMAGAIRRKLNKILTLASVSDIERGCFVDVYKRTHRRARRQRQSGCSTMGTGFGRGGDGRRRAHRGLTTRNRQDVIETSARILSQCVSPHAEAGSRTGLVVGYVQSGKTLSFTTVAALANDNGFGIIVVIAGMTNELSRQSHRRLVRDLGVEEPFSSWAEFFEPTLDDVDRTSGCFGGGEGRRIATSRAPDGSDHLEEEPRASPQPSGRVR